MKVYHCKLINDGKIQQHFYRAGENVENVLKRLEVFLWPKGVWEIEEATDVNNKNDAEEK